MEGVGGSAERRGEAHLPGGQTAKAKVNGRGGALVVSEWPGQLEVADSPQILRHLGPYSQPRSAWRPGSVQGQRFSALSHLVEMWGCPLQGSAFILKNVRKEIYRLPSSSFFGRICCDWKLF